tara:strand:- start:5144 stop:5509 length:366 start_codon:yes stop_codon:yes gene_type:complete
VGVLHHLQEPVRGWKELPSVLESKGLMRIGLYSEIGRETLINQRSLILKDGIKNETEEMLKFRQKVVQDSNEKTRGVARYQDFYSTSMIRDLIFHTQEVNFDLLEISEILETLGLRFLGFE